MKTGIILYCYNEEDKINDQTYIEFINTYHQYHICFVNNASNDKTLIVLKNIQKQNPDHISIVDIKKKNSKIVAIRAGARYLGTVTDIATIGFIDVVHKKGLKVIEILALIKKLESADNLEELNRDNFGRNFLKKSISGFIKSIVLLFFLKN